MALILVTDAGSQLCNKVFGDQCDEQGRTQTNNYLYLFEMFMCFELWASKEEYWKIGMEEEEAFPAVTKAIRNLLKTLKTIARRTEGNAWKLTKFHELLHLLWYMKRFGAPRNYDAGMGEKNHQVMAKLPASSCQKIYATFDKQVMDRLHELFVLNRALEEFKIMGVLPQGLFSNEQEEQENVEVGDGQCEGSSFHIFRRNNGSLSLKWARGRAHAIQGVMPELLEAVVEKYFKKSKIGTEGEGELSCQFDDFEILSEYKTPNGITFRAHPQFRNRQWYDWSLVTWELNRGRISKPTPCKIMMIVSYICGRADGVPGEKCCDAIVWSADGNDGPPAHSVLTAKFKLQISQRDQKPIFHSIDASLLGDHCFCYPNFGSEDNNEYFMVYEKSQWADKFCSF
jgi:hypothetical protein